MAEDREHSPFGGSNAHIWLRCSKSAQESAKWPSTPSSPYAEKGTNEHWLGSHCLSHGDREAKGYIGCTMERLDGKTFIVTKPMIAAVQLYLNDAWANIGPDDEYYVEQQFSLHTISNQLYGHNDLIAYKAKEHELWLWDYKGGAGIYIEAEGNEQLAFYMVGALLKFAGRPINRIVATIVQPNYDCADGPIRRWEITPYEAFEWYSRFAAAYKLANSEQAAWVPGKHCRWCAGAGGCDALHLASVTGLMEGPAVVTPDPKQMTALELGHRLRQAAIIELWIKTLRERAYAEALAGRPPHGFKLVDKRAQRKWNTDAEHVGTAIMTRYRGLPADTVYPRSLISPAQLEKLVGKESMTLVKDLIVKESSGKALVPDDDDRQAVAHGIDADFGDIIGAT